MSVVDQADYPEIGRRVDKMLLSDQSWPEPPDMSEWPPDTIAETAWKHGFSAAVHAAKYGL